MLQVINCKLRLTKISKVTFKGEVKYATAHCAIKWSQFIPKTKMKGQGSHELVEELNKERKKIDN